MLLFITHSLNIYSVIEVEEQDDRVTNMRRRRIGGRKLTIGDIDISKGSGDQYCVYIRGMRKGCLTRKSIIAAHTVSI